MVCTKEKEYLFGRTVDGSMQLNECGDVVANEWLRTAEVCKNGKLDEFIVVPNHLHGILIITDVQEAIVPVRANRRLALRWMKCICDVI